MKKYLLLTFLCLAMSSLSFGQFKIIAQGGNTALNGDTIVVTGNTNSVMDTTFNVVNTGLDSVTIYARRDSLSLPMNRNRDNYFCWVYCYDTATDVSQFSENISRGDTSTPSFICYYEPYGHTGAAFIRYTFFAARNHADSAWVVVEFNAIPLGVKNISGNSIHFSSLYPNPASNSVIINYNLTGGVQSANLKVFNMVGECIRSLSLNTLQGTTNMNVQGMPSGIYICELQAQGCSPVYQKLVVSH